MGDVVNLNRWRKAQSRAEAQTQAIANRALHGRTGAEKKAAKTERRRQDKILNGHRLETDDET